MLFCTNCGTSLDEGSKFCRKCGAPVRQNVELPDPVQDETFDQLIPDDLIQNDSVEKIYPMQKRPGKGIYKIGIVIAAVLVLIAAAAIPTRGFAPLRAKQSINLGNKYLSEGKYEEAILAFQKAISIDAKDIDSRCKLSDLYIKTGKDNKAENLLKETLALDKTNQDAYILLAGIYEKEKDYEKLIKLFNEGLLFCKEKYKLQGEFDKLLSRINTSDIKASVVQGEKYTLPTLAEARIGGDRFELPIDWKGKDADTSEAGTQKLEGTIQFINRPIAVNLSVELKPAVVTENKTEDEGELYHFVYKVPVVNVEGKYAENAAKLNSSIMEHFNEVQAGNSKIINEASPEDFFEPGMKYDFFVNYEVKYNKNGRISIVMTYYFYTGGIHGYGYKEAYNYDLVEGKELSLQDLFIKDVNAYNLVKEEVTKQMLKEEEFIYFDSINTVNNYTEPFNFYFNEEGVVIWFGEYEVASYSRGMPEFLITRNVVIK